MNDYGIRFIGKEGSGKSMLLKKRNNKALGFVLGLMYAPFLWGVTQSYFYLGNLLGAVMWSNEILDPNNIFVLVVFTLFTAVMGLIIVLFPIWFYQRFMNNGKTRSN